MGINVPFFFLYYIDISHLHNQNSSCMKQITMSPVEFTIFKQLAKFFYDFAVSRGNVIVTAKAEELEHLGY
jgi:hypothetical protein